MQTKLIELFLGLVIGTVLLSVIIKDMFLSFLAALIIVVVLVFGGRL